MGASHDPPVARYDLGARPEERHQWAPTATPVETDVVRARWYQSRGAAVGLAATTLVVGAATIGWPRPPVETPGAGPRTHERRAPPASSAREASTFIDELARGRAAYAAGDLAEARHCFEQALGARPDDPRAMNDLAQIFVRQGDARGAVDLLAEAVEIAPDEWEYRFNLARALGEADRWPESVDAYRRASAIRANDFPTMFNLARALHKAGQERQAVAAYEEALPLAGRDLPDVLLGLALASEKIDGAAAIRRYEEYLDVASEDADVSGVQQTIRRLREEEEGPQLGGRGQGRP
ncbi:MAG: tetratricopeptide repeat protein [Vicinamibacterales bacterium]